MVEYLPRKIEAMVKTWLSRDFSVVLVGPRQAGKTTLLKHLAEENGWTYLTLDDPNTFRLFSDIKAFAKLYRGMLLIDEAQYDPEVGRKLKYLHDVEGIRFIASGSGSFDIKVRVTGELVGRAARLVLLPLSFEEFVRWKADENVAEVYKESREATYNILRGKEDEPPVRELPHLESLWKEYVVYGGYPAVVKSEEDAKTEILQQIVSAYIDRDVIGSLGVREHVKFLKVVEFLARSIGSPLKKNTAMEVARVSFQTLESYLAILLATFIVFEVSPLPVFKSSARKSPKVYFYDLGIRNVLVGDLRPFVVRGDRGELLENFVARHLAEEFGKVFYYRSKAGAEVDFIVNNVPIEVKLTGKATKALHRLKEKLNSPHGIVFHLGPFKKTGDTVFIPAYYL